MPDKRNDTRFGRRPFLSALAAGGLLSSVDLASATAATDATTTTKTYAVEQNGNTYYVTPLSNGESAEAFFGTGSDGGAELGTSTGLEQSDTSQLFLYENPDGTVSLVVTNDAPDGTGGAATYSFDGLPADGSWTVRDEPDAFANAPVDVSWEWGPDEGDGGVFEPLQLTSQELVLRERLKIQPDGYGEKIPLSNPWHYLERFDRPIEGFEPPVYIAVLADNADFGVEPPTGQPRKAFTIDDGEVVPKPANVTEPTNDVYFVVKPRQDETVLKFLAERAGYDNRIWYQDDVLIDNTTYAREDQIFTFDRLSNGVRISSEFEGVDKWQVLSGDSGTPRRYSLDPTSPIKLRRSAREVASLNSLVEEKSNLIETIQSQAATSIGTDEAQTTVDQSAEELLGRIDDGRADASQSDLDQYREALERMVAAEEVTQAATDVAVEEGALVDKTSSNVWSASVSVATELASKVGGSILKRVFDGLMNSMTSITGRLLDSLRGAGAVSDDAADDILAKAREMQSRHFYTMQAIPESDRGEITGKFGGDGVKETANAAKSTGLLEGLENETEELQAELEELLFEELYYRKSPQTFAAVVPPTPDEVELAEVHADVDIPDEMLPWWIDDTLEVPDEISIDFDADIDMPEVPVLDDLNDVKNGANVDLSGAGGVNAVIDEAMDDLDALLGSLDEQDDDVRGRVSSVGSNSTAILSDLAERLISVVESIQEDVLKDAEELVTLLMVVGVAGTAILLATGVGAVLMVQATILMAQVATVLSATQIILDLFQSLVGAGTLGMMAVVHYIAVDAITGSDLGGVTID